MKVQIISSSIRDGRETHGVALFLKNWMDNNTDAETNIIDLKERDYPLFHERLSFMKEKHEGAVQFSKEIDEADAVIIVSPEYNGSFPASLKNVIDLLYEEWQKKPVGLALGSSGDMAGAQVTKDLQFVLYKIGAHVSKARFHVGHVGTAFNDDGSTDNEEFYNKHAKSMWENLEWLIKANQ